MTNIDARGLSCPQPVLMALKFITEGVVSFTVEVDHITAAENVERACREKGYTANIEKNNNGYVVIVISKALNGGN